MIRPGRSKTELYVSFRKELYQAKLILLKPTVRGENRDTVMLYTALFDDVPVNLTDVDGFPINFPLFRPDAFLQGNNCNSPNFL